MDRASVSVRGLAAIAVACALACLGAAGASAAQVAVVGSLQSDEVSLIDTGTNQVVGDPIEAGDGPASVAITPDGRYAYVADAFGGTVAVIDLVTRQPVGAPISVGATPFGLAITPDGSRVFVTDRGSDEVSVIDTATREVVTAIPVGQVSPAAPTGIAVAPDGKLAYVTIANENAVDVIDTATMAVIGKPIRVGTLSEGIELAPDGKTAYVVDQGSDEVSAIDTATGKVTPIKLDGEHPRGIVVAPDGKKAFVVELESHSVAVIDTEADREIEEIEVGNEPQEVAISASGGTVYVTVAGGPPLERTAEVERIDVATGAVIGPPIELPGEFASGIAITPDQSPVAAFTVPDITAGVPASFSAGASTDPDGTVATYFWTFGDGGAATRAVPTHTYREPGTYDVKLSVADDEGCGEEMVFTGRTAYCTGGASSVTHPVIVKAPPAGPGPTPPSTTPAEPPSNNFRVGRLVHNRRNGTVRLQVKLPSAGFVLLLGQKVHAVTRKSAGAQSMWLTIHARVELAKRLKKTLRAPVRFRITFTPNGGTPKTVHRAVTLERTPRHKQHRH